MLVTLSWGMRAATCLAKLANWRDTSRHGAGNRSAQKQAIPGRMVFAAQRKATENKPALSSSPLITSEIIAFSITFSLYLASRSAKIYLYKGTYTR
jgi:hypothetical protein